MNSVADASAIIAYMLNERGRDEIGARLPSLVLSIVNLAEVHKRMIVARGLDPDDITRGLTQAGVALVAPDAGVAAAANRYPLMPTPKGQRSLSLADGFCIAQAEALNLPLLTADRVWAELPLPVRVELAR